MFKHADVVRATGVSGRLLSQWLDRKIVKLDNDDVDSETSGVHRLFSAKRVHQVAIVHELTRAGLPVSVAGEAASVFTDNASPERAAGALFPEGYTLLVHTAEGTSVVNAHDRAGFEEGMSVLFADSETCVSVVINGVVSRVDRALASTDAPGRKASAAQIYRHGKPMMVA